MKISDADAILARALASARGMWATCAATIVSQARAAEGDGILDGVAGCEFVDDRIRLPE